MQPAEWTDEAFSRPAHRGPDEGETFFTSTSGAAAGSICAS
jgi:hypothetical protein